MATANARGDDDRQRAALQTNSGQGAKSAFEEMKRRARAKPQPSSPPVQTKGEREQRKER